MWTNLFIMENEWIFLNDRLPEDKQEITVFDEAQQRSFDRTFYLGFWVEHKRVLWTSQFCTKWKPRSIDNKIETDIQPIPIDEMSETIKRHLSDMEFCLDIIKEHGIGASNFCKK